MKHASASQIKQFSRCPREWHLQRYTDLPTPESSKAAALGKELHKQIEIEITTGTPAPSPLVAPGRQYWPKGGKAEHAFTLNDGPVPVVGVIDILTETEVIDHKTTSDLARALTPERLARDPQMLLYAHAHGGDPVRLTHLYYSTKRPQCVRVSVVVTRSEIDRRVKEIYAMIAAQMQPLASKSIDSFTIPGRLSACGAFGGCSFIKFCSTKKQGGPKMANLKELLAARRTQAEVIAPEAPPRETPQPKPDAQQVIPLTIEEVAALVTPEMDLIEVKEMIADKMQLKRVHSSKIDQVMKAASPTPAPEAPKAPTPAPAPTAPGLVVLVDCLPTSPGAECVTLAEVLAPVIAAYPTDPQLVDYGKGIAEVVAAAAERLPGSGYLLVNSDSPYWGRFSQSIYDAAICVIRAVK